MTIVLQGYDGDFLHKDYNYSDDDIRLPINYERADLPPREGAQACNRTPTTCLQIHPGEDKDTNASC